MSAQAKAVLSPEEYLAIERNAEYKSEYFAGEMFAMAGASEAHILIVTNVVIELGNQLKSRPCRIYSNDMRVKVSQTGLYTYPDVVVVCGKTMFDDDYKDILLNPTLIVEVLSESTEGYDRGRKFEHYRHIESFSEYLLIAQDQYRVEQFVKQNSHQWLFSEATELEESITLTSINCKLVLKDIYDKVEFEREAEG
jgi:Uma2 family endonuclease